MSLRKNITFQFIVQLFGIVSGIIVSVFTARALGAAGRGELGEFTASLTFLAFFLGMGIEYSILSHIANKKYDQEKIINTALLLNLLFLFVAIVLWQIESICGISFLFRRSDYYFVIFILLCFYVMNQNGMISAALSGNKLYPQQQKAAFFTSCFNMMMTIVFFIAVMKWDLWGSFRFYLPFFMLTLLFPLGLSWYFFRKHLSCRFSFHFLSAEQIKMFLGFSFVAYFANVFQYLSYKTDFWLVERFLGKEMLGNYALVFSLLRMFWILPASVSSVIVPYSVGNELKYIIHRNNKIIRVLISVILIIYIVCLPVIDHIILILYGKEFAASAFIIKFLLLGVIPYAVANIITAFFIARRKIIHNLVYTILLFSFTVAGDILLIPRFGVVGLCAASLLASFGSTLYLIFVYKNYSHSLLTEMFLIKKSDFKELKDQIRALLTKKP